MRYRLAFLATHPIQYHAPLFRKMAAHPEIDLTVYFCSRTGVEERLDPGFGRVIKWDLPLLQGYRHRFLTNLLGDELSWQGLVNPAIIREICSREFDALCIHGWAYPTALLAFAAGRLRGVPVLFRAETNFRCYGLNGWGRRLQYFLLKQILRRAAGFLAIGTLNEAFYVGAGISRERLFRAPYAVDNDFFQGQAGAWRPQKEALKEKHGLSPGTPIILFCGKLLPAKDPFTLLQAFRQVRQQTPCSLVLVGDGRLQEEMKAAVEQSGTPDVRFAGFRNQTELPEFYALADIMVLPSAFEPWGLVVNEAMCFALPIIISDQVGCGPDLVREGENGLVFPAGDAVGLASGLMQLVTDPGLRSRWGQRSLELIRTWNYDADVRGLLEALGTLVPAKRGLNG
jgi:glycosyltransferase involved in cell wall biosynthesis